jgi:hypothetical protein
MASAPPVLTDCNLAVADTEVVLHSHLDNQNPDSQT